VAASFENAPAIDGSVSTVKTTFVFTSSWRVFVTVTIRWRYTENGEGANDEVHIARLAV
jgi:hypothetical protein